MKLKKDLSIATFLLGLLVGHAAKSGVPADNSARNRSASTSSLTSEQQGTDLSDVELARRIRRELMRQADLSTYARNVKIISINGVVTLKGPVRSRDEQARVLQRARTVAGAAQIVNQMSIAPFLSGHENE